MYWRKISEMKGFSVNKIQINRIQLNNIIIRILNFKSRFDPCSVASSIKHRIARFSHIEE